MSDKTPYPRFLFSPTFFREPAVQAVRVQFGAKGELTAVKLLCESAAAGYALPWTEEVRQRLLKELPGVSYHLLEMIVRELVRCGMFDRRTFEKGGILSAVTLSDSYPLFSSELPTMTGKLRTLRPIDSISSEETAENTEETPVNSEETRNYSELYYHNSELSAQSSELSRNNSEQYHHHSELSRNNSELSRNNTELFRKSSEYSGKIENSPQNPSDYGTFKERS